MNILLFDVVPTNIVRFFRDVVSELNNSNLDINFFFLLEENDHNDQSHVEKAYPFAKQISYVQKRDLDWFVKYLAVNQIDAILTNAQRLPDDMVILASKSLNIPSFMIQHGMYIPFMKRTIGFYFRKVDKTLRFFKYALSLAAPLNHSKTKMFLKYFKCFVMGRNQLSEKVPREKLNVDWVYVYGEYWKEYHAKQFGYTYEQQVTVGYPDLEDVFRCEHRKPLIVDSICYIAQTLVEDGRLDRASQVSFFESLVRETSKKSLTLYVKLHPRSDRSLFLSAKGYKHVMFVENSFPKVSKYIGHYSTLLAKGMLLSNDVCIFEYRGHPTPDYFVDSSSMVITKVEDISVWLSSEVNTIPDNIEKYFECQENISYTISKDIINKVRLKNK